MSDQTDESPNSFTDALAEAAQRPLEVSDTPPWLIEVRDGGRGRRPWRAYITWGVMEVGEIGSTRYPSRTPEGSLKKALRTVAELAAESHSDKIEIHIEVTPDSAW